MFDIFELLNGTIALPWNQEGNRLVMNIEILVNSRARVHIATLNTKSIQENKKPFSKLAEIKIVASNEKETILEIGSGKYSFSVKT